tara:strand:- start:3 stop:104 length:102 start_codon:yes stop_codon:yes gene_type:complete
LWTNLRPIGGGKRMSKQHELWLVDGVWEEEEEE